MVSPARDSRFPYGFLTLYLRRDALLSEAGLHWLPPFPLWFAVGLFLALPASAWIAELRCQRQLTARLKDVPDGMVRMVRPPAMRTSRKTDK